MTAEPMELLELAGRIIMESGGETFRVEETVTRMGRAFGLNKVDSFAIPSGVFISYRREDGTTETSIVRTHRKGTDLMRVNAVNTLSRQAEAGCVSFDSALEQLRALDHAVPSLPPWLLVLGATLTACGFTLLFGGGMLDCTISALDAGLMQLVLFSIEKRGVQGFASTLIGSVMCTLLPTLFLLLTGLGRVDAIVGGALMPLLPGLGMTNAVQDTLRGDMVSGVSHAVQATLTAALIAGGALMATNLCRMIGGL